MSLLRFVVWLLAGIMYRSKEGEPVEREGLTAVQLGEVVARLRGFELPHYGSR